MLSLPRPQARSNGAKIKCSIAWSSLRTHGLINQFSVVEPHVCMGSDWYVLTIIIMPSPPRSVRHVYTMWYVMWYVSITLPSTLAISSSFPLKFNNCADFFELAVWSLRLPWVPAIGGVRGSVQEWHLHWHRYQRDWTAASAPPQVQVKYCKSKRFLYVMTLYLHGSKHSTCYYFDYHLL